LLSQYGMSIPPEFSSSPAEGGIINLPAIFIVCILSLLLVRGIKESATVNNFLVIIKVAVVLMFIILGWKFVNPEFHTPFIPENNGADFGGLPGIAAGAALVFFAFIGFDAVSTAAQEAKNPKKGMPIGILGSLAICTVLYIIFAYVMTGVANYKVFTAGGAGSHLAPVAIAVEHMGSPGPDGVIVPEYKWLNTGIIVAILLGYSSVILVMLLGQSRVFYSMSRDGLVPSVFSA